MANKIQLKRGIKSRLSTLSAGEPAFTTDTRELFVGTGSGNVNMSGNKWYNGTALSGISTSTTYTYSACPLVKLGDMYINTTTGGIYECTTAGSGTTAKWTYKGCIKGANGSSGKDSFPISADSNFNIKLDIPVLSLRFYTNEPARVVSDLSPGVYFLAATDWIEGDPIDEYQSIISTVTGEEYTANTTWWLRSDAEYLVRLTDDHKMIVLDYGAYPNNRNAQDMYLKILANLLKPYLT